MNRIFPEVRFYQNDFSITKSWAGFPKFENLILKFSYFWMNHTFPSYLIGPYDAGPKSALFLRMVLIRAGVNGADVQKAIFKGQKNIL